MGGVEGGLINLPALLIALLVTSLLVIGTSESAKVNAVLVAIKVTALTAIVAITLTSSDFDMIRINPFLPAGVFVSSVERRVGIDCVSTCRSRWPTFNATNTHTNI